MFILTVSDVSVDTVIMDSDEEEEKAVINERSILRVVSSSQSFRLDTDDLDNSQGRLRVKGSCIIGL